MPEAILFIFCFVSLIATLFLLIMSITEQNTGILVLVIIPVALFVLFVLWYCAVINNIQYIVEYKPIIEQNNTQYVIVDNTLINQIKHMVKLFPRISYYQ